MHFPSQFIESLQKVQGFSKDGFEQVHLSGAQVTSIRMNPLKHPKPSPLAEESVIPVSSQVPWCSAGYYLQHRPSFTLDPLFHAGCYYVQEASSMFIEQIIKTVCPDHHSGSYKVLDLCAAPGGKSTHLSTLFPESLIVANEVIKTRTGILIENAVKWGTENIVVTQNDPADFKALSDYFDVIVVDAPCSGSGMFRKDPAAMEEWSLQQVALCSRRQQRILQDVWPSLKENGVLIYSTCSYSEEENEAILDWMAAAMDAETVAIPKPDDWGIVESVSKNRKWFGYRFFPDKTEGEGFFVSCVRKKSDTHKGLARAVKMSWTPVAEKKGISAYIVNPEKYVTTCYKDDWLILPESMVEEIAVLNGALRIRKCGVKAGRIIREELMPAHDLAVSLLIQSQIPAIEADRQTALDYLSRKEITVENAIPGWNLIRFSGCNLGWAKILKHRVNNYYPMSYRILKR